MSRSLGTLTVDLIAKVGGFVEGMGQAERVTDRRMREIRRSVDGAAKRVRNFIAVSAAAVTAGAALTAALVNSARQSIDEQAKLARSLDGTITGLRSLHIAAADSGIDGLDASLNRLNRRLGAVEMEGGPALQTVERLGLSLEAMRNMDADERLAYIADRIRDYGGSAQESARHLQQLGFEQKAAIELFRNGGDAIRAAREEADLYGLSLSMVDAGMVEAANDSLGRMAMLKDGLATQLTVQLAPVLKMIGDSFQSNVREAGGMDVAVSTMFDNMVDKGIAVAITMRSLLTPIKEILGDMWDGFRALPSWAQEAGVIGAIVGGKKGVAIVGGISWLLQQHRQFKDETEALAAALEAGAFDLREWGNATSSERNEMLAQFLRDLEAQSEAESASLLGPLFRQGGGSGGALADEIAAAQAAWRESVTSARREIESGIGVDAGGGVSSDFMAGQRELELAALYAKTEEGLRRQVDLYGETSQAAQMLYDIEAGRYGDLEVAQQVRLVELANEMDLLRHLEDQDKEAAEARRQEVARMAEFGRQAARNIQTHFADFLFDPFDEGIKGMAKGFAETLRRMAAEAASAKILGSLFSGMAGSQTGWVSSLGNFFAGKFDGGGYIPAGKIGIVGEVGPEIVQGPALVTGREETARMLNGGGVQVNIINNAPGVEVRQRRNDQGLMEFIVEATRAAVGNGELDDVLGQSFGLNRARGMS